MPHDVPHEEINNLIARVPNGSMLALPKDESGVPMEATRSLIRRGIRGLHLLCVPVSGLQADLLIGAGCAETVECGGIVLSEIGVGPRFRAAVREGELHLKDSSCPVIHAGLQAGEKGLPFVAIRGFMGSDLLSHRDDWRVIENPFVAHDDPVLLVPPLNPDVFIFHAALADRFGNVWIAGRRDLAYTAHASKTVLVTAEKIIDKSLYDDEFMAAGTLSAEYVTAIAHAPRGAWPLGLARHYDEDRGHLSEYARLARTADGFAEYLSAFVYLQDAVA